MTPEQILAQQASNTRAARLQSAIDKEASVASRTQHSAQILGYNADVGVWMCALEDGTVVWARSLSPGGSKGSGDVVSLYKPMQGMALIKSV